MSDCIRLRGARAHNLDHIDLDLPHRRWIAVGGVSGSGKTSLVFDTLVREGQRRFLGAWAPRARLRLGKLGEPPVDELVGLPTPLAMGVARLGRQPRSTVGTTTGLLDLLRLWWARDGDPGPLSRSELSFQRSGACPACTGLGVQDEVAEDLLVADPSRSIRDGALRPTLPNGYTVYSQVTLEVMDTIARAHDFTVDTPWNVLTREQQEVVLYGTDALVVPFGKHSISSRLKWKGITAKPREEGHYRGIIPVIEETLRRSRNANILKYTRSVACPACDGTRLAERARQQAVGGTTLPDVLATPLRSLAATVDSLPDTPVAEVVRPQLVRMAEQAAELGLGHLTLARGTMTLSDGELQRCRLLSQLGLELSGMLLAFDEPTLGLHAGAQPGLARALRRLVDRGNTVVVVEHDPAFVHAADRLLLVGPGAGDDGGELVADGPVPDAGLGSPPAPRDRREGTGELVLTGASLHNLNTDLTLRHGALNVVFGPSGAGKSTLLFRELLPALEGRARPGVELDGQGNRSVRWVDATPLGRTPRSTPATYTGLFDRVRKRFAKTDAAKEAGFTASHFSHNHKRGRCPACEGLGVERIGLHLVDDLERPCPRCDGGRYRQEVNEVTVGGLSIAEVLRTTPEELLPVFGDDRACASILEALVALGLGHLQLGRSTTTLSRGEAQRVKLASLLGQRRAGPQVVLLDEPDRGLHPRDVQRLLAGLHALADAGHTVVAISHHPHVASAADHLVEVRGGIAARVDAPPPPPPLPDPRPPVAPPSHIQLSGVSTHNLQDLVVRIPHRALTVVTGPSGSGKSSLVFDTLAAEAQRRYAETLPFAVRRELRRLSRPTLDHAAGLTPTLSLRQGVAATEHGTVASVAGLDAPARLLWSRLGRVAGEPVLRSAAGFSPHTEAGRCPDCGGRGWHRRLDPDALITSPEASLWDGAARGTVPGRHFTRAGDRHLALLEGVIGAEALRTPWRELPEETRQVVLHGAGPTPVQVTWSFRRGRRSGTHELDEPWLGLVALIEEEAPRRAKRAKGQRWWEPFVRVDCPTCDGERLVAEARRAEVGGLRLPAWLADRVSVARGRLEALRSSDADTDADVLDRLLPRLLRRLHALDSLGLGDLRLSTPLAELPPSVRQRLHLVEVLQSDLVGLTLALDEPGAGLGPEELPALVDALRALVHAGQTVVVVTHREAIRRAADHEVRLGPGAGPDGGRIVASGAPASLDAATVALPTVPGGPMERVGPWSLPRWGLAILTGPAEAVHRAQHDLPDALTAAGRRVTRPELPGRRKTILTAMDWLPALQALFHAAHPELPARAYSFHSPAGRCPTCRGSGVERVSLDILADLQLPCPACLGRRYRPEVLVARWQGHTIADVLEAPASTWRDALRDTPMGTGLATLIGLGLGHLPLGTPVARLSGGERRRLGLAASLAAPADPRRAWVVERPDDGLATTDLVPLVHQLAERAREGELFVVATPRQALREAGLAVAAAP